MVKPQFGTSCALAEETKLSKDFRELDFPFRPLVMLKKRIRTTLMTSGRRRPKSWKCKCSERSLTERGLTYVTRMFGPEHRPSGYRDRIGPAIGVELYTVDPRLSRTRAERNPALRWRRLAKVASSCIREHG